MSGIFYPILEYLLLPDVFECSLVYVCATETSPGLFFLSAIINPNEDCLAMFIVSVLTRH